MPAEAARRRWLIRALLALLLLSIALVVGGIFYLKSRISPAAFSAEVSALLRRRFGLALTVGELEFTWAGNARLRHICIRNEKMRSTRCLLAADIVELDFKLLPLLRKEIHVRGMKISRCELNLFSEKWQTAEKNFQVVKSWEFSAPTPTLDTAKESSTAQAIALQLDHVEIDNGLIAHEAEILPLPLGQMPFAASLRDAGKDLHLNLDLPDSGRVEAQLALQIADFASTARRLLHQLYLSDNDKISGTLVCTRCNLSRVDERLQHLTGKLEIEFAGKELQLRSRDAHITSHYAHAPQLLWDGTAKLQLPQLVPLSGEGTFTGQGLVVQYLRLAGSEKAGIESDFSANLDLARLPKISGFKGELKAQGSVRNRVVAAHFVVQNFATDKAPFPITAENLEGNLRENTIALRRQKALLGKNAAELSLDFTIKNTSRSVSGTIAFGELNLDDWLRTNAAADSGNAPTARTKSAATQPFSAQLSIIASSCRYKDVQSGKLSARLMANEQSWELNPVELEFGRGRITGSYRRELSGRQNIQLRVASVRAQDLKALVPWKATLYGLLDAEASGSFTGNTPTAILQNGQGRLSLHLGRGKIKDSFLQKGIFTGPLHKLEDKFADIEFASAMAEARLDAGKLHIHKLAFDAEEWNVAYRAEADNTGQGKAELIFRFRESFVANVANPLHLGIAERKEGDFYDLPFVCRGKVSSGDCYRPNW